MTMRGKYHSDETKEKMSKSLNGHICSDETRKKIGLANSGPKSNLYKDGRCKDPEYIKFQKRQCVHKRKSRIKEAIGSHTFGEWELLKIQYGFKCPCCGKSEPEIKLTEDHIIPLSKGGSDFIENIQPLCFHCNNKKHTKIIKFDLLEETNG